MSNDDAIKAIQVLFDLIRARDKELYKQAELIMRILSQSEHELIKQIKQQMIEINTLQEQLIKLGVEPYGIK